MIFCKVLGVTYPSLWFGDNLKNHDTSDLFKNDWIKINL